MAKKNDFVEVLRHAAERLGWTEQPRHRGGWVLFAPAPQVAKIVLPEDGASLRDSVRSSWMRKVVRYADPMKRAVFLGTATGINWEGKFAPLILEDEPKVRAERVEMVQREEEDQVTTAVAEKTIVEERPFLAHRSPSASGGLRYSSQAVTERLWSDGTTDYACAWPRCDYHHENYRAVSNHYGSSRSHVEASQKVGLLRDPEYVEPLSTHLAARLARWRKRLSTAMVGLDPTADDFLERLAERMVAQAGESTTDGSGEPLTAEQVLERVRRLVDDGSYLAAQTERADLEQRVQALEASLELAQSEAQTATYRAERAVDRWNSLRDLIDEEVV